MFTLTHLIKLPTPSSILFDPAGFYLRIEHVHWYWRWLLSWFTWLSQWNFNKSLLEYPNVIGPWMMVFLHQNLIEHSAAGYCLIGVGVDLGFYFFFLSSLLFAFCFHAGNYICFSHDSCRSHNLFPFIIAWKVKKKKKLSAGPFSGPAVVSISS